MKAVLLVAAIVVGVLVVLVGGAVIVIQTSVEAAHRSDPHYRAIEAAIEDASAMKPRDVTKGQSCSLGFIGETPGCTWRGTAVFDDAGRLDEIQSRLVSRGWAENGLLEFHEAAGVYYFKQVEGLDTCLTLGDLSGSIQLEVDPQHCKSARTQLDDAFGGWDALVPGAVPDRLGARSADIGMAGPRVLLRFEPATGRGPLLHVSETRVEPPQTSGPCPIRSSAQPCPTLRTTPGGRQLLADGGNERAVLVVVDQTLVEVRELQGGAVPLLSDAELDALVDSLAPATRDEIRASFKPMD